MTSFRQGYEGHLLDVPLGGGRRLFIRDVVDEVAKAVGAKGVGDLDIFDYGAHMIMSRSAQAERDAPINTQATLVVRSAIPAVGALSIRGAVVCFPYDSSPADAINERLKAGR